MKSAYELAMERLEKQHPVVKLSKAQKLEIAEVESLHRAKIAEQELFLKGRIANAIASGHTDEAHSLERQLAHEVRRIQEDSESKKEKIRLRDLS
jgi:hypothetical protein